VSEEEESVGQSTGPPDLLILGPREMNNLLDHATSQKQGVSRTLLASIQDQCLFLYISLPPRAFQDTACSDGLVKGKLYREDGRIIRTDKG
jgi:hypothetical protein